MKVVCTIEARMTSSRLPGKVLMSAGGKPLLQVLIERLRRAHSIDRIVLATTLNSSDDALGDLAAACGIGCFRGSEADVLGRVRGALDSQDAEVCVEITADCPLVDPAMIDAMVASFVETRHRNAYVANTTGPQLGAPHGFDVQVFEANALRVIEQEARDPEAREHVSLPFYRAESAARWNPRFMSFFPDELCRRVWLSLDYPEDYALIRDVHEALLPIDPHYGAGAVIDAALARAAATRACLQLRGW
jgi:spore coat polysaccharide biosynthesis protein SpsF